MGGSVLRTHVERLSHRRDGPSTALPTLTEELPRELQFPTFCLPLGLAPRTPRWGILSTAAGEAARPLPLGCPRGLQTFLFSAAAFGGIFVYLAPGYVIWSVGHVMSPGLRSPLLGNRSPTSPRLCPAQGEGWIVSQEKLIKQTLDSF